MRTGDLELALRGGRHLATIGRDDGAVGVDDVDEHQSCVTEIGLQRGRLRSQREMDVESAYGPLTESPSSILTSCPLLCPDRIANIAPPRCRKR